MFQFYGVELNYSFQYTIDPAADEPIMLILNSIGNETDADGNITSYGIQGEDFCRELLLLDSMGKRRIQIWINSVGGSVIDGYSILGAILKSNTRVDTYNIGVAASTAGWLFQAGEVRDMCDYATWMGHNPQGEDCEIKERMRLSIVKIISERTGKSETVVGAMLDRETYMNAEECLESSFCDKVTATSSQNVMRMTGAKTIADKHRAALEIVNKILPIKNNNMADVHNRLSAIESQLASERAKYSVLNKSKEELQQEYNDLKLQLDRIKAEMEEADETDRTNRASEMVNSFADMGKIENKPDVIAFWVGLASVKGAHDKVKEQLEKLPVNKVAAKVRIEDRLTDTGDLKNMDQRMLKIAQRNKQKGS